MGTQLLRVTSLLPTRGLSHWREKQDSSEVEKDAVCSAALHPYSDAFLSHWKACLSNLYLGALILAWPELLEEGAASALPLQTIPGWWCYWHSTPETGSSVMGLSWWAAQCSPNPDTANTHGAGQCQQWCWCHITEGSARPLLMDLWLLMLKPVSWLPHTSLIHSTCGSLMTLPCCDVKVAQELSSSSAPSLNMGGEVWDMPLVDPHSLPSQPVIFHCRPHLCSGSFFGSRGTPSALWLG